MSDANALSVPSTPEPSSARLVLTLGMAGLLSGLAIVAVYEATLPTITENKARELEAAVFEVVPGAVSMQRLVYDGEQLRSLEPGESEGEAIFAGYDTNELFIGYAMPAEGAGFQDAIKLIYGYEPESRTVIGMRILDSRETPGLGDKIFKDAHFVANFRALSVDPEILAVKEKTERNHVDTITGATISSKAVVSILNQSNEVWLTRLPDPGGEPPLVRTGESP